MHAPTCSRWACVVYEMAGGKRAFGGESVLDTLHAIARTEPQPVGEINAETPADLERIIKKCLAKDRDHRYQHASDVLVDLRNLIADFEAGRARSVGATTEAAAGADGVAGGLPWRIAIPAAMALLLVGSALTWFTLRPSLPDPPPIVRFPMPLPEGTTLTFTGRRAVAMSPAGVHFAFSANGQIWIRAMNDPVAVPLRGTENLGRAPFFSPDGEWVGFWRGGELLKVPTSGGQAVKIGDAPTIFGASWGADNRVVFGRGSEGIWSVSGDGGEPEQQLAVADGSVAHGPQILPDGRTILYTLRGGGTTDWDDAQIVVQAPGEEEPSVVITAGHGALVHRDRPYRVCARGCIARPSIRPREPRGRRRGTAAARCRRCPGLFRGIPLRRV